MDLLPLVLLDGSGRGFGRCCLRVFGFTGGSTAAEKDSPLLLPWFAENGVQSEDVMLWDYTTPGNKTRVLQPDGQTPEPNVNNGSVLLQDLDLLGDSHVYQGSVRPQQMTVKSMTPSHQFKKEISVLDSRRKPSKNQGQGFIKGNVSKPTIMKRMMGLKAAVSVVNTPQRIEQDILSEPIRIVRPVGSSSLLQVSKNESVQIIWKYVNHKIEQQLEITDNGIYQAIFFLPTWKDRDVVRHTYFLVEVMGE
ncbi:uncharacterized protein [Chiloscyllium punctatum]|uniref:uncharacterized protein isoform X2 n=1 Tax=Chiloscyllium punctatum TaxID=137246 RepID=UPI003B63DD86